MLVEKKDSTKETPGIITEDEKKNNFVVAGPDAYGMYYLQFEGGGRVPDALAMSKWTAIKEAQITCEKLNSNRG